VLLGKFQADDLALFDGAAPDLDGEVDLLVAGGDQADAVQAALEAEPAATAAVELPKTLTPDTRELYEALRAREHDQEPDR